MDFMTAVRYNFQNYFNIEGRAQRSQYWWFTLFMFLVYIGAGVLDVLVGFPIFYMIAALGFLAPSICVAIRRMHDHDKSGWWLLIGFVPVVGFLYLLYLFVIPGTAGDNNFGPDPLG